MVLTFDLIRQSPFFHDLVDCPHRNPHCSVTLRDLCWSWAGLSWRVCVCRLKSTHCLTYYTVAAQLTVCCTRVLCFLPLFNWIMFVIAGCWKDEDWTVCRCCSQDCWKFSVKLNHPFTEALTHSHSQQIYSGYTRAVYSQFISHRLV